MPADAADTRSGGRRLRVRAIAPLRLDPAEVVRRQKRYDSLAGDQLSVELVNLGDGAPPRLDSADDIAASEDCVRREAQRTDPRRFDVILPDCVLDPAVDDTARLPVPIVGILRLAAGHLASLGKDFAAVTRNRAIGEELRHRLGGYGLSDRLVSVELLDVAFDLVSDQAGWARAMHPIEESLSARGVTTVLNGCSAVELADRGPGSVHVVDPTKLALHVLAVAAESSLVRAAGP